MQKMVSVDSVNELSKSSRLAASLAHMNYEKQDWSWPTLSVHRGYLRLHFHSLCPLWANWPVQTMAGWPVNIWPLSTMCRWKYTHTWWLSWCLWRTSRFFHSTQNRDFICTKLPGSMTTTSPSGRDPSCSTTRSMNLSCLPKAHTGSRKKYSKVSSTILSNVARGRTETKRSRYRRRSALIGPIPRRCSKCQLV